MDKKNSPVSKIMDRSCELNGQCLVKAKTLGLEKVMCYICEKSNFKWSCTYPWISEFHFE